MKKTIEHFGTEYGGWWVMPELIPDDGLIIDAGVGTDISFATSLLEVKPNLRFIGIDHTEDSAKFCFERAPKNYTFINKAVAIKPDPKGNVKVFKNPKLGSESLFDDHRFVGKDSYQVPAVDLGALITEHKPCLVKLDIEGAEYDVYHHCFGVPQICIEFHHRMMSRFNETDTEAVIKDFESRGYRTLLVTSHDEALFVQKDLLQ